MSLIQQGIEKGLITLDGDQNYITYVHQNKKKNYKNPEENVQAEAFLQLVITYGYSPSRIKLFQSVTIGSDTREANIIVYNNDAHTSAHIIVECKKEEVSELEFKGAKGAGGI